MTTRCRSMACGCQTLSSRPQLETKQPTGILTLVYFPCITWHIARVHNDVAKLDSQLKKMFVFTKLALLITFSRTILGLTPVRGTPPVKLSDPFEGVAMIGDESFQGCGGTGKYHCFSDICGAGKFLKLTRWLDQEQVNAVRSTPSVAAQSAAWEAKVVATGLRMLTGLAFRVQTVIR